MIGEKQEPVFPRGLGGGGKGHVFKGVNSGAKCHNRSRKLRTESCSNAMVSGSLVDSSLDGPGAETSLQRFS